MEHQRESLVTNEIAGNNRYLRTYIEIRRGRGLRLELGDEIELAISYRTTEAPRYEVTTIKGADTS